MTKRDKKIKKCFRKHFLDPTVLAHHALLEKAYDRVYMFINKYKISEIEIKNQIKMIYEEFMNNIIDHYFVEEMLKGKYIDIDDCFIYMKSFHDDYIDSLEPLINEGYLYEPVLLKTLMISHELRTKYNNVNDIGTVVRKEYDLSKLNVDLKQGEERLGFKNHHYHGEGSSEELDIWKHLLDCIAWNFMDPVYDDELSVQSFLAEGVDLIRTWVRPKLFQNNEKEVDNFSGYIASMYYIFFEQLVHLKDDINLFIKRIGSDKYTRFYTFFRMLKEVAYVNNVYPNCNFNMRHIAETVKNNWHKIVKGKKPESGLSKHNVIELMFSVFLVYSWECKQRINEGEINDELFEYTYKQLTVEPYEPIETEELYISDGDGGVFSSSSLTPLTGSKRKREIIEGPIIRKRLTNSLKTRKDVIENFMKTKKEVNPFADKKLSNLLERIEELYEKSDMDIDVYKRNVYNIIQNSTRTMNKYANVKNVRGLYKLILDKSQIRYASTPKTINQKINEFISKIKQFFKEKTTFVEHHDDKLNEIVQTLMNLMNTDKHVNFRNEVQKANRLMREYNIKSKRIKGVSYNRIGVNFEGKIEKFRQFNNELLRLLDTESKYMSKSQKKRINEIVDDLSDKITNSTDNKKFRDEYHTFTNFLQTKIRQIKKSIKNTKDKETKTPGLKVVNEKIERLEDKLKQFKIDVSKNRIDHNRIKNMWVIIENISIFIEKSKENKDTIATNKIKYDEFANIYNTFKVKINNWNNLYKN